MTFFDAHKPVVNIAADEAQQLLKGKTATEYCLLDVRQPEEYEKSRIPGSVLIPIMQLTGRLDELDPDKTTIIFCAEGGRSHAGAAILLDNDFSEVYNLRGGIKAWTGEINT